MSQNDTPIAGKSQPYLTSFISFSDYDSLADINRVSRVACKIFVGLDYNLLVCNYAVKLNTVAYIRIIHQNAVFDRRTFADVNAVGEYAVFNLTLNNTSVRNKRIFNA